MWSKVASSKLSSPSAGVCLLMTVLVLPCTVKAQTTKAQSPAVDDSNVRPPVTRADLQIVKRAREILDQPSKWNRADNRECPAGAKTYSLYCALQMATNEVSGKSDHRGAALQEARFVIDEIAANRNYDHRLMGYNNDPATSFADIQEVFRITESLIALRLKVEGAKVATGAPQSPVASAGSPSKSVVTKADLEIVKRVRQILDSPSKWNRADNQECPSGAKTLSLYCAFVTAASEIKGAFDNDGAAVEEARVVVDETAPNHKNYGARLKGFNNDPSITFADLQKLLQLVEERLAKRLAENTSK